MGGFVKGWQGKSEIIRAQVVCTQLEVMLFLHSSFSPLNVYFTGRPQCQTGTPSMHHSKAHLYFIRHVVDVLCLFLLKYFALHLCLSILGNMSLIHGASIAASAAMFATSFGAKQSVTCLFSLTSVLPGVPQAGTSHLYAHGRWAAAIEPRGLSYARLRSTKTSQKRVPKLLASALMGLVVPRSLKVQRTRGLNSLRAA